MTHPRRLALSARTIVLGVTFAAVAAAGAGCSAIQEPGSAAIVNGTSIRTSEVVETAAQINGAKLLQQPMSESDVTYLLIYSKVVLPVVAKSGSWAPDSQFANALAKIPDASQDTVDALKTYVVLQSGVLSQADQQQIVQALTSSGITVDPRLGTFDTQSGSFAVPVPNWISATPTATATAPATAPATPTAP